MDPLTVLAIINGTLTIIKNHAASGSTEPLTAESIHAQLLKDISDGESEIAKEFAAKGWTLPG